MARSYGFTHRLLLVAWPSTLETENKQNVIASSHLDTEGERGKDSAHLTQFSLLQGSLSQQVLLPCPSAAPSLAHHCPAGPTMAPPWPQAPAVCNQETTFDQQVTYNVTVAA